MPTLYSYRTTAHWTGRKRGIIEGENIPRTINFAAPPEFGGDPGLWTPEHLLLAAVSTCYVATLRGVADASKADFQALELVVEGTIEKQPEGGFRFTRIHLRPVVTIEKEEAREHMGRLLEKAERVCLITRSLSCATTLEPKIVVQEHVSV
jgi:peroxiredoxin-like protein